MEWQNIVITGGVILAFFGAVSIIGSGIKVIKEWVDPVAKITERCDKLEQRADDTDVKYEKLEHVLNAQSRLLIEITNHMITGNDIDKLKEKRDELTSTIIGGE